ncbi:MAG: 30S ribosome-binding factor RbfA [Bdellovibrionales bacterium]|nr:30S ribosome-binding factor RbfA [Bdellovibrionales bacterium]
MSEKSRRVQRVEKEVREVISTYLMQEQSGSSEDLISLTQVVVSPDLRNVKAYVCVIGRDEVDDETLEVLATHAPDIQRKINSSLRMKFVPKVRFYNDPSVRMMAKIDSIVKEES